MAVLGFQNKEPKHLLSLRELNFEDINAVLDRADYWAEKSHSRISHIPRVFDNPIICNLFFESSTRTRFSFEVAAKRLGYHVLNFHPQSSSTQKGETVYDTLKTLEAMGIKVAIIRTAEEDLLQEIAPRMNLAVINAGAGANEHPTQGLLDLLTIRQHFGHVESLKIAIIGDIKHSRVANSNMVALERFGAKVLLSGPQAWMPPGSLPRNTKIVNIDEAVKEADVVMLLRVQRERHRNEENGEQDYLTHYGLSKERARQMKDHAVIMHPAPFNRGVEIDDSLIESERSLIYRQVANGVAVRMAVLERALA
jgi:aspartate carbamoyltransferase catalytic subunit